MAARHNFRKLNIWADGIQLVIETYAMTKAFPKSEIYALSNQMQRCSVSMPSNIAEGTSRGTDKHFLQFLETALGSAFEWETQLIIAYKIKYISEIQFKQYEKLIRSTQGKITRFMESLQQS